MARRPCVLVFLFLFLNSPLPEKRRPGTGTGTRPGHFFPQKKCYGVFVRFSTSNKEQGESKNTKNSCWKKSMSEAFYNKFEGIFPAIFFFGVFGLFSAWRAQKRHQSISQNRTWNLKISFSRRLWTNFRDFFNRVF
jgi:hypothetical protein